MAVALLLLLLLLLLVVVVVVVVVVRLFLRSKWPKSNNSWVHLFPPLDVVLTKHQSKLGKPVGSPLQPSPAQGPAEIPATWQIGGRGNGVGPCSSGRGGHLSQALRPKKEVHPFCLDVPGKFKLRTSNRSRDNGFSCSQLDLIEKYSFEIALHGSLQMDRLAGHNPAL